MKKIEKLIRINKNDYVEFDESVGVTPQQLGGIIPQGYIRYIWFAYFSVLDAFNPNMGERRVNIILAGNDPNLLGLPVIAHFETTDNDLSDIQGGDIESPIYVVRPDYSDPNDPKNKVYASDFYGNATNGKGGLLIAYYDLKE